MTGTEDSTDDRRIAYAATPLVHAYRTMLGLDGSAVEEAVEAAYTPTGPPRSEIRERIRKRRRELLGE